MNMKSVNKSLNNNEACKLVVLGRTGVGKSAIVVRFLTKRFIWEYDPTLECAYRHQTHIDEEPVTMEILDTAGSEFSSYFEGHIRWADGFVIAYDVTDRGSFEDVVTIKRYLDEVRKPRTISCVIVGNKTDLEQAREVSPEEGERLAADSACAFFETSACDGCGEITECFHELYREVRRRKVIENKPRRRSSAAQVKQVLNKMFTKMQTG